jgi:hypothetical protein
MQIEENTTYVLQTWLWRCKWKSEGSFWGCHDEGRWQCSLRVSIKFFGTVARCILRTPGRIFAALVIVGPTLLDRNKVMETRIPASVFTSIWQKWSSHHLNLLFFFFFLEYSICIWAVSSESTSVDRPEQHQFRACVSLIRNIQDLEPPSYLPDPALRFSSTLLQAWG